MAFYCDFKTKLGLKILFERTVLAPGGFSSVNAVSSLKNFEDITFLFLSLLLVCRGSLCSSTRTCGRKSLFFFAIDDGLSFLFSWGSIMI